MSRYPSKDQNYREILAATEGLGNHLSLTDKREMIAKLDRKISEYNDDPSEINRSGLTVETLLAQRNFLAQTANWPIREINLGYQPEPPKIWANKIAIVTDSLHMECLMDTIMESYFPQVKFECFYLYDQTFMHKLMNKIYTCELIGIIGMFSCKMARAKELIKREIEIWKIKNQWSIDHAKVKKFRQVENMPTADFYRPIDLGKLVVTIREMASASFIFQNDEWTLANNWHQIMPFMRPGGSNILIRLLDYDESEYLIIDLLNNWPDLDLYCADDIDCSRRNTILIAPRVIYRTELYYEGSYCKERSRRYFSTLEETFKTFFSNKNNYQAIRYIATLGPDQKPDFAHDHFAEAMMVGKDKEVTQRFCSWLSGIMDRLNQNFDDYPIVSEEIFTRRKDLEITEMSRQPESQRDIILTG